MSLLCTPTVDCIRELQSCYTDHHTHRFESVSCITSPPCLYPSRLLVSFSLHVRRISSQAACISSGVGSMHRWHLSLPGAGGLKPQRLQRTITAADRTASLFLHELLQYGDRGRRLRLQPGRKHLSIVCPPFSINAAVMSETTISPLTSTSWSFIRDVLVNERVHLLVVGFRSLSKELRLLIFGVQ